MITKLSKTQQKELLKRAKKNNGSISARDYREVLSNVAMRGETEGEYYFEFDAKRVDENSFLFTLKGKHLSTNVINTLSRRNHIRYKNAIKESARNFFLVNKKIIPEKAFEKATIKPTVYLRRSRDDDNSKNLTLKTFRDLLSVYGFIVDDKRKNLKQFEDEEVVGKEYKIELLLQKV
jgi:hypothetical protein